jgi:hypothetical protein
MNVVRFPCGGKAHYIQIRYQDPPLRSSTVLNIYMQTVLKRGKSNDCLCVSSHKFTALVRISMFSELNVSTLNLYHDECTMYIVQCTYCSLLAFHSRELSKMYRYI